MAKILLAVPTYLHQVHSDLLFKMHRMTSGKHQIAMGNVDSSAICLTMNSLWIQALDGYEAGAITHFAMLHTDIIPEDFFIDKLADIMEREQADIVSAIVPIKNQQGFTSTALEQKMGDADPYFRVRRLTMTEVMKMPPTFTDPAILLNTGLMLVDLSKAWTRDEDVYFTIEDRIVRYRGRRVPHMWPEDWGFSRRARKAGAKKLVATREIALEHAGLANHPNYVAWGTCATDEVPAPDKEFADAANLASKVSGYMSWEELAWLAESAKGRQVVEIGSWLGRSTKAMAQTASKVWAVDSWKGSGNGDATGEQAKHIDVYATFRKNLESELASNTVTAVTADHAAEEFMRAQMFSELFGHDWKPDMVFIDGSHEYEDVKRDIQTSLKLLDWSGMLSGHDFNPAHPGVIKAVQELVPGFKVAPGTTIWYVEMKQPGLRLLPPVEAVVPEAPKLFCE